MKGILIIAAWVMVCPLSYALWLQWSPAPLSPESSLESPTLKPSDDQEPELFDCPGGCRVAEVSTDSLSETEIEALLRVFGGSPASGVQSADSDAARTEALETLLFHGRQTQEWLAAQGGASALTHLGVSPVQWAELTAELAKSHVWVTLRVVDAAGNERVHLHECVPVGIKQHLHAHADGVASPELGFTVQRVGVEHLWTRL